MNLDSRLFSNSGINSGERSIPGKFLSYSFEQIYDIPLSSTTQNNRTPRYMDTIDDQLMKAKCVQSHSGTNYKISSTYLI